MAKTWNYIFVNPAPSRVFLLYDVLPERVWT